MKLSEAIRLGAMTSPRQCFGKLADGFGGLCAMGCALAAIGREMNEWIELPFMWRWLGSIDDCPVCGTRYKGHRTTNIVAHLNDDHQWSREQIADYIETLESAEQPALKEATNADAVSGALRSS